MTTISKNLFLFYGEDDFSLRRKIEYWKAEFAKKYTSSAVSVLNAGEWSDTEIINNLQANLSPSLFASKKLIIIRDGLPTKTSQEQLADYLLSSMESVPKDFFLIFWQSRRPDGRLSFTKKFISKVEVTEFTLPHGTMFNAWILAMAKTLGVAISPAAADKLAQFLGRDLFEEKKAGGRVIERKEAFDLWQAHSELSKLSAATGRIEVSDVDALVRPKVPDSVFTLTEQVVAKNQKGAFQALENFLAAQTTDEKTSLIKIIGLLSEQLRSLLVVSLLSAQGLDNTQIAEKLGWSSGRVFITARNQKNISVHKLKSLLNNLQAIDAIVKTSDSNQKLELDLFLAKAAI